MKRSLIVFIFISILGFFMPAKADIMPYYVNSINPNSIGIYQPPSSVKIYNAPNEKSELLVDAFWSSNGFSCSNVSAGNLFVIFSAKKEYAFLSVVDENENGDWLQISYENDGIKTGWVKKYDEFKFMTWRNFFNIYGRKFGLYYLKDAPEEAKTIYSNTADDAQNLGKITYPNGIKLTTVRGNWALVLIQDIDKSQKIGWIKWRDISGAIYLFPDMK